MPSKKKQEGTGDRSKTVEMLKGRAVAVVTGLRRLGKLGRSRVCEFSQDDMDAVFKVIASETKSAQTAMQAKFAAKQDADSEQIAIPGLE